MERKDSRPLYVMDDAYIEQKYVKAEEERQRQEAIDRVRREQEEARALEEAERQRKAAEAERKRKKDEEEQKRRLEEARRAREQEEARRKEVEKKFQTQLDEIEEELATLETDKNKVLNDRILLNKDLKKEKEDIENPLNGVREELNQLQQKEQMLVIKLKEFERKKEKEQLALEQKEKNMTTRAKELTTKRREVQTQMLNFLQQANVTSSSGPATSLQPSNTTTSVSASFPVDGSLHASAPSHSMNYPTFDSGMSSGYASTPAAPNFGSPSVEIVSTKPTVNDLNEQIALLDQFLREGVLTREDYEDAKRKVYEDANKAPNTNQTTSMNSSNPNSNLPMQSGGDYTRPVVPLAPVVKPGPGLNNTFGYNPSQGQNQPYFSNFGNYNPNPYTYQQQKSMPQAEIKPASMDAQLSQLDDYLRSGVLTQSEYEDAKKKVFADAGLIDLKEEETARQSQPKTGASGVGAGTGAVVQATTNPMITVMAPHNSRPGQTITITFEGRFYNVVIPAGVKAGQPFTVSVPRVA